VKFRVPRSSMTSTPTVRAATNSDVPAILRIAEETKLFEGEGLAGLGDMIGEYFHDRPEGHSWVVLDVADTGVVAAAYCAPEPFTSGVLNLYFLGVSPTSQGVGAGGILTKHVEEVARTRGERVLIVETSGVHSFEPTREFYRRQGFTQEARIRDYYADGDDKITFWKRIDTGVR
jgi:ribosomal protein S18 acetylase RimI-like enzyme